MAEATKTLLEYRAIIEVPQSMPNPIEPTPEQRRRAEQERKDNNELCPRCRRNKMPCGCGKGGGGSEESEENTDTEQQTTSSQTTKSTRAHVVTPMQKSPLSISNIFNLVFFPREKTLSKELLEKLLVHEIYATPEALEKIKALFDSYVQRLALIPRERFSAAEYSAEITPDGALVITMPNKTPTDKKHKEGFLEFLSTHHISLTSVAHDKAESAARLGPAEKASQRILEPRLTVYVT